MYRLTIKTIYQNRTMTETIRGGFWLTYFAMNTLYDIDKKTLDRMFQAIDKENESVAELEKDKKKFSLSSIEFNPEQSRNELGLSVSILKAVVQDAGDKALVKLCTSFVVRLHNVISKVKDSI